MADVDVVLKPTSTPGCSQLDYITSSRVVTDHPAFLSTLVVSSCCDCPCTVSIYDGHNTDGRLKLIINAPINQSVQVTFPTQQYFPNGIYVEHGTNVAATMVQFCIDSARM